ncbi:hypothetical protein TEA_018833 [Camellia sinensis var. sinensis]|uniref:Plasma membrane-associated cation-binding protein 1 n=1 Tax=Camellia sinensis var. sinensis TaxID=542762 RepID=A0A4S4DMH8_CAMSN|nr:hypothetical protein TEA_018833 [Camellia sinensis var. sinensis]
MDYWKTKVLPKIKKVFDKNSTKKAAAAEVCKTFDDSKEEYSKEFEEKKTELQPKVIEIYEASSTEIKFPGSKAICEASSKLGPTLLPGPIFFVFEKVSTFIVTEEKAEEPPPETSAAVAEETGGKEIVVEEGKKEEVVAVVAEGEPAVAEPPPTTSEPPKVEEQVAAEPPKP